MYARYNHVNGFFKAKQTWQTLGATTAWQDAKFDFWQS